jgi:hypothetical protein
MLARNSDEERRHICEEATEACLKSKEPTTVEMESVENYEEVPKEKAAMKTFRALKERYGDRRVEVGRRRELMKRAQGDCGSGEKLIAAVTLAKKTLLNIVFLISRLHAVRYLLNTFYERSHSCSHYQILHKCVLYR